MSTATKSTPLSISPEKKWTLSARRSSLALNRRARRRRPSPRAADKLGPVILLAALDLGVLGEQSAVAGQVTGDGGALGVEAQTGPTLAVGADAVVGNVFVHVKDCNA